MSSAEQPTIATLGSLLLHWMATEDRSPGYLATRSAITAEGPAGDNQEGRYA